MLMAVFAGACPARAETVARWRPLVAEASRRFGVPVPWIERVMQAESRGRTMLRGRPIVSQAGAMGLMQLMPRTWEAMRARFGLARDPFDPRDNILAGTAYLRLMYERFGYPGLFAAYNAGPARYAAFLGGRRKLPAETNAYLDAIIGGSRYAATEALERPPPTLFVRLSAVAGAATPDERPAASFGLFAIPERR
jgi:soluble lytic murein transglycosylase-like protein